MNPSNQSGIPKMKTLTFVSAKAVKSVKAVVAVLAVSMSLAACSTKPIVYSPQVSPVASNAQIGTVTMPTAINTPNVVIKRDKGLLGSACSIDIYLDGVNQGSMKSNSVIELKVPVDGAERIISARIGTGKSFCPNNLSELAFTATGDKVKYFRVSMTSYNTFSITPSTNLILK